MDQNHAPPSPIRQHRPSSRHGNQPSQDPSTTPIDNKLKNPVGLTRPTNPCTSPPVATSSLTAWTQESSDPSSLAYVSRPQEEGEASAVECWRAQAVSWDNSNTQPLASSSRCPSPHQVSMDIPLGQESASGSYHSYPSSSLLTSAPLNRTASANPSPSPAMHFPEPSPLPSPARRKRNRASSLPNATPLFKRRKSKHDTPTPSDDWKRTYERERKTPTKIDQQRAAAADLGRRLLGNRSQKGPAQEQHCVVACRQPAINVHSLRSLDASEILKNPQLRHDLLFDSLAFRPVNLPNEVPNKSGYAEVFTGGKTPVVDPRASSAVADMYWETIAEELATGCRCVRWKMPKGSMRLDGKTLGKLERIHSCLCGRWRKDLNEKEWWSRAAVWPSRLPELIKTLREILVSLMGSTTPCPNHFAHSFSKEALEAHEATCPTVTHALVPELYAALDPEFLTIQVRRSVFDLALFEKLGEAMKVHCAPVRDDMVDDMVKTALSGDVAKGLRKCFDCAEVMKLDIANHQVHALRPYLWEHANTYEFAAFQGLLVHSQKSLESSQTRDWINAASRRVLTAAEPKVRSHLIGKCGCRTSNELVVRALSEGFMDLVFGEWSTGEKWPPAVQRRQMGSNGIQVVEGPIAGSVNVPESLKMDSRRIKDLHAEVTDIAVSHMILLAFRNFFTQTNGKVSQDVMHDSLTKARLDIEMMMDKISALQPNVSSEIEESLLTDLSYRLAFRIVRPSVIIAPAAPPSMEEIRSISEMAKTLNGFIRKNIQRDSELLNGNLQRLRIVLNKVLSDVLLSYRLNPASTFFDPNADKCQRRDSISTATAAMALNENENDEEPKSAAREIRERHETCLARCKDEESALIKMYGLEGVAEPIKEMTERMVKLVAFNLSVFGEVYGGPGMMVGS
ncbi:hypothetical protein CI109_106445 [Kwoniella shandongensis]|uniref:Uncharacterized protein n=1 Tax=Kwoniella shandongensis TaxID=1734106 RepID=A0A5M6C2K7_9TREE|nr:uncharacterized protein CI109_002627 [Kwoniella shandongensis]KAA5528870.1 hypothetical protein CI109_002627 [Kwoniella shandongensis]